MPSRALRIGAVPRRRGESTIAYRTFARAWLAATVFSGIPSTAIALLTGGDPWEATRAAGAMLVPADSPFPVLLVSAGLAHGSISLFWATVLYVLLPRRRPYLEAIGAAAAIGLFDLGAVAPALFPEVAALAFWPQLADHLMWGACWAVGLVGLPARGGARRSVRG